MGMLGKRRIHWVLALALLAAASITPNGIAQDAAATLDNAVDTVQTVISQEVAPVDVADQTVPSAEAEAAPTAEEAEAAKMAAEFAAAYEKAGISEELFTTNNLWIMLAGCLVFIMHLGFACVETGLTRAKNTVNILFKNVMIVML
ncbi:MAG: hypothetical protein V3V20_02155, partial [Algisphaera sp.]